MKTTTVLVMLTVPAEWTKLTEEEITRKLRANDAQLTPFLAKEVKRWGNTGAMDLSALRTFLDERGA